VKTLLALIEKPGHVCYRYRVAAFEPFLQQAGWRLEAEPVGRGLAFLRQLQSISRADAVILQRRLLNWWQLLLLRRNAKRLLFDIDDAVFFRDSNSPRGPESWRRRRRFDATVRASHAVLCGNPFLADAVRRAGGTAIDMPTCVDGSLYAPAPSARVGAARVVWIGSRSTMPSLDALAGPLAEATRRCPGLTLAVICDAAPSYPGVNIEFVPWSEATEAKALADGDFGISILPEHLWSQGKCGLKVVQYMAAGLPAIANPYGVHEAMIVPGATGMLAKSPAEWIDAVVKLANGVEFRHRLGAAARAKFDAEYSVAAWGTRFVQAIAQGGTP
jgi:glycosyltransferase involved in cell wall biosynthesis